MSKLVLYRPTNVDLFEASPFNTLYELAVPTAGQGQDGDFYLRYHNGTEATYKKVLGSWELIQTSLSYINGKLDMIDKKFSGPASELQLSTDIYDEKIDVFVNGQRIDEHVSAGSPPSNRWKRDAVNNKVLLGLL